jgi:hypothetical protein
MSTLATTPPTTIDGPAVLTVFTLLDKERTAIITIEHNSNYLGGIVAYNDGVQHYLNIQRGSCVYWMAEILAPSYHAELVACLTPDELTQVHSGVAVPNDFYDANDSLAKAWLDVFGQTPLDYTAASICDPIIEIMNCAMDLAHSGELMPKTEPTDVESMMAKVRAQRGPDCIGPNGACFATPALALWHTDLAQLKATGHNPLEIAVLLGPKPTQAPKE